MVCVARDKCGVFLAASPEGKDVSMFIYWGLIAQNHRGHHSHGILTLSQNTMHRYCDLGLVPPVSRFLSQGLPDKLKGNLGIGHVRYATSGKSDPEILMSEAQPFVLDRLALAFNGNLVNTRALSEEFKVQGSDVKLLLAGLRRGKDLQGSVEDIMENFEGAYSVVGLSAEGELFAFRDPLGIRPLCWGERDGELHAISSETVGLDINRIPVKGEIQPGELVTWEDGKLNRIKIKKSGRRALCSFEFAYFARPDSVLDGGKPVYKVREELGRNLAKEYSEIARKVDVVISIPETGDDAAYGFHEETGIPWERAVRRHRFIIDRAFISSVRQRELIISRKVNVSSQIRGKRVAVIDDSIVRGDTSRKVVKQIREAGAKEVYLFITFPKIVAPCFYGIDMATFSELIGFNRDEDEIARMIGADAVCYQTIDGLVKATGLRKNELCLGCLTCEYPTPLAQQMADKVKQKVLAKEKEMGRIYETFEA